jgi:multidrug efflux pump subunit AcrA (membrane-fusion protein)
MLKNLDFKIKISLAVFLAILIWILSGVLFKKQPSDNSVKSGGGKADLLVVSTKEEDTYKLVSGYGVVDRGQVAVYSQLNSNVVKVKKAEGSVVKAGEPVIELLNGVLVPSPIEGKLDVINVFAGDLVFASNTKLFSAISNSKIDAILRISAGEARLVKAGQTAKIELGESIFEGKVYFVSSASDKTSNTFDVKIKINASNGALFHGEVVKISIQTEKAKGVFLPTSALSITAENRLVIKGLKEEGEVLAIPVEILQTKQDGIWVKGDFKQLKFIIIRGADFVNQGEKPQFKIKV